MNDLISVTNQTQLTSPQVVAHVRLIQKVMEDVMIKDVHYGVVPGTDKPSLWKPGAELLCVTFRIAPSYQIEDLSTADKVRYRIRCIGTHQVNGAVLGEGLGECSSDEEKYKWRKVYKNDFEAVPADRRRVKRYTPRGKDPYDVYQVRTEPADVANTILKMSCKRAQVAMTINVTAASDIFAQDLEDLPEGLVEAQEEKADKPAAAKPKSTDQATETTVPDSIAPPDALVFLKKLMDKASITDKDICKKFGIEKLEQLKTSQLNAAIAFVKNPNPET